MGHERLMAPQKKDTEPHWPGYVSPHNWGMPVELRYCGIKELENLGIPLVVGSPARIPRSVNSRIPESQRLGSLASELFPTASVSSKAVGSKIGFSDSLLVLVPISGNEEGHNKNQETSNKPC
jgi:hypothetical protein